VTKNLWSASEKNSLKIQENRMAHNIEIRLKCRALFEVLNMTLSAVSKQESIAMGTLSEWKNDDREEFGGIWVQGCKAGNIEKTTQKLREELEATSVYDEMKSKLHEYEGVTKTGELKIGGILTLANDNKELQAQIETDVTMLASVQADYFDSQLFKNSMLSSIVLNNQVTKDVSKIKQSDIKASSEIHKIAKEARFGKLPDTVIFNANGEYSKEELAELSLEDIEKLYYQEQRELLENKSKVAPQVAPQVENK
jgi:hypothetical protein